MTRCVEFYDKVEKDGNFCGMSRASFNEVKQYIDFVNVNAEFSALSENTLKPLMREKDERVKEIALIIVRAELERGEKVTSKTMIDILVEAVTVLEWLRDEDTEDTQISVETKELEEKKENLRRNMPGYRTTEIMRANRDKMEDAGRSDELATTLKEARKQMGMSEDANYIPTPRDIESEDQLPATEAQIMEAMYATVNRYLADMRILGIDAKAATEWMYIVVSDLEERKD